MDNFFFALIVLGILSFCVMIIVDFIFVLMRKEVRVKYLLIPAVAFIVGFFGFAALVKPSTNSDSVKESQIVEKTTAEATTEEETSTVEDTTAAEETTTQPKTEETATEEETTVAETESEDEFKSSCQEIGYKKLLRTPDDYVGQRIVITAEVQQVIDGGLFDDSKYYRVQTDNSGSGYYFDDEYFMYDNRVNDDMKILDKDVLKIYGEFTGLETIKRAMTGTKDEVPAIKAYYIELINE